MTASPRAIQLLGLAGLLPPAGLLLWDLLRSGHPAVAPVLVPLYAALIFSFLGGCWWAFAMAEDRPDTSLLVLAVSPSLIAFGLFIAAFWIGPLFATLLLAAGIALSPLVDWLFTLRGLVPPWWLRLRLRLSLGLAGLTALSVYPLLWR